MKVETHKAAVATSQEAATEALRAIADGKSRLNELEAQVLAAITPSLQAP